MKPRSRSPYRWRCWRRASVRLGSAALLLWLAATSVPGPARAQAEPAEPGAAETSSGRETGEAVSAIPTPRIASAAERVERAVRGFRETLTVAPSVGRIQARRSEIDAAIDAQAALQARVLENPSLRELEELADEWQAIRAELPDWNADLSRRAEQVEGVALEIEAIRDTWQATRAAAIEDGAPEAITALVDRVLESLAQVRGLATERRAELLTLLTSVSGAENRIATALAEIEARRGVLVSRVFERDREPIWSPAARETGQGGLAARFRDVVAAERTELARFVRNERERIPIHGLLFAALAFALHFARARVRSRSEEEEGLGRVAEVFELPLSVAMIIAILATPTIYGYVPSSIGQLLGAAALVPTVLVLRRFTAPPMLPLLNALVVFYFTDRLRELTAAVQILSRSIFVVEMLVAVGFLAWLLRPARLAELPAWAARTVWLQAAGLVGRLALMIFAVALVAEVAGYSRLAQLLGGAPLESAYVGVVAYAAVRILDSLVTFALRVKPLGLLKMVQRSRYAMRRRIRRVLRGVALAVWTVVTLDLFAVWTPFSAGVSRVLTARATIGSISFSAGDVLAFVLTVVLAILLSRFLRFVLEEDVYPRMRLGRGVPYAISTFLHYVILIVGFVLAVAAMGIDLDRFALLAGAFGVGIGFGLQNVVNNFVSGLILLSERPIQVGDTIEAGGSLGEVERIGIRSSTVRTWSGAELIVPNAELISERVTNWTLSDRQRRIDVPFGVAYGTDRRRVLALMEEVAEAHPDVLAEPAPTPLFKGFGDSSLDFELRAWTGDLKRIALIASELSMAIGDALDAAGIEVPFPQRDLHLRSVDRQALSDLAAAAPHSAAARPEATGEGAGSDEPER